MYSHSFHFLLLSTIFDHFCSCAYWLRCSSAEFNSGYRQQQKGAKRIIDLVFLCVGIGFFVFLSISNEVYEKLTFVFAFQFIHSHVFLCVHFRFFHPFQLQHNWELRAEHSLVCALPFYYRNVTKPIVHTSIHQCIGLVHW